MKALEIKIQGGDQSPWSTPGSAPAINVHVNDVW